MLCIHRAGGICAVGDDAKGMAALFGAFRGGLRARSVGSRAAIGKRSLVFN